MTDRITIDPENPRYWRYGGERTLLLGASDTDNLFQWTGDDLETHLDRLVAAGGNYVRNTMSDRGQDDRGDARKADTVHAFAAAEDAEGRYDLTRWNDEYWRRLEAFLDATAARDVVVELTLWDQHDLGGDRWATHPWNPENNVNYGRAESGLDEASDFFATVAAGNEVVSPFQERFVRAVLDRSLEYGNVLYNVSNEGWAGVEWENAWCDVVREAAAARGVEVHVANMNMSPRVSVDKVIADPDRYAFVEVSQHNNSAVGRSGQAHWDDLLTWRLALRETVGPRPLNNVKVYGAEGGHEPAGDAEEAVDRVWRAVLAGCASARFHRRVGDDNWGIGASERALSTIRALRALAEAVDLTEAIPRNDLLVDRDPNESYCVAAPGGRYAVYFPAGGSAVLDLAPSSGSGSEDRRVRWLDARTAAWQAGDGGEPVDDDLLGAGEAIELRAPDDGRWVGLLEN